jgi:hypothetical protein
MFLNFTKKRSRSIASGFPGQQRGAVTMFSAVLILILLTEMLIYAVQVGVFEQRKSGNEMRQKQAFHAAETGIQHAQEYLLANVLGLVSQDADGWLSPASERWLRCDGADLSEKTHPCYGEPLDSGSPVNLRDNSYFYSFDDPDAVAGAADVDVRILADKVLPAPTETVTVNALLCILDVNRGAVPPVQGCLTKDDPTMNPTFFVVTLLARGQAECDADGDCAAEALVAQKLGSYGPLSGAGGPGVPLTSRSTFPPSGTAEIVPNPNGGGPGVPISSWLNANITSPDSLCDDAMNPLDPIGGSWTTCERHEWYGVDIMPGINSPNGKYTCPTANCSCGSDERRISYAEAGGDVVGMDIVIDSNFPCDLFEYTFKEERENYDLVKADFTVIKDCGDLGPDSKGLIWVDGSVSDCRLNSVTIGSPEEPVFLVSAAELTTLVGNAIFYGVMFITDVEKTGSGEFAGSGTMTIYGAVIVDGPIDKFSGTYQIVYNDDLIDLATKRGSLGKVYGGWTDFHEDWR